MSAANEPSRSNALLGEALPNCKCGTFNLDRHNLAYLDSSGYLHTVCRCPEERWTAAGEDAAPYISMRLHADVRLRAALLESQEPRHK